MSSSEEPGHPPFKLGLEPIVFLLLSLLLLSAGLLDWQALFSRHARIWVDHSATFSQLLFVYAGVFFALALASAALAKATPGLTNRLLWELKFVVRYLQKNLSGLLRQPIPHLPAIAMLVIALGTGTALAASFLSQPIRYDEALTYLQFSAGPFRWVFFYPFPNNHVLHTILVKTMIYGLGMAPPALRLPAFLAGIGSIPLLYLVCRAFRLSGLLGPLALAVFPIMVLYSSNARGYSLMVFLFLWMLLLGTRLRPGRLESNAVLFSVLASLSLFTIPSALLPVGGAFVWLVFNYWTEDRRGWPILCRFAVPTMALTALLTGALYTPVVFVTGGVETIVSNRFVEPQSWSDFALGLPSHLQQCLSIYTRDVPVLAAIIGCTLMAAGILMSVRRQNWALASLLPIVLAVSAALIVVEHRIPFPRTWIYLVPVFLIMVDAGYSYLLEGLSRGARLAICSALVAAAGIYAASLLATSRISNYPDTGTFPEAELVAKYLKPVMTTNDSLTVWYPYDLQTLYYMDYYNVPSRFGAFGVPGFEYIVVKQGLYSVDEMTGREATPLFTMGDLTLYRAPMAPEPDPDESPGNPGQNGNQPAGEP